MKKLFLLPLVVLTGCAYLSSHTVTPVVSFNGTNIVVKSATTDVRCYTLFDAQDTLTKFRNSNGGPTNTYTSGTVVGSVNETSSSSNLVLMLQSLAATAQSMATIASKAP